MALKRLMLSFGQQRLWYLEQLNPGISLYNVHFALHMKGKCRIAALHSSFHTIIQRHEILRTSFEEREGMPCQVIHGQLQFTLPVLDLRSLTVCERQKQVEELAQQEAHNPFDLSTLPLLRIQLLWLQDEQWQIFFTHHHLILDGWSLRIFFEELSHGYQAYLQGEAPTLPPIAMQYADYTIWQHEQERQGLYASQRAYWQKQLHGAPTVLDLPMDQPRSPLSHFSGGIAPVRVNSLTTERLRALARREGCSLYMVVLAVWLTVLYRYSNQDELVIGTLIANRTTSDTERLLGFLANTLALRVYLGDDPGFCDLLQRVRAVALGAYEHQALPFEQVVSMMHPSREANFMPLVQVVFTYQNARGLQLHLPGLETEYERRWTQTAKFDLVLDLIEDAEELRGALAYNADLFTMERMNGMVEHLNMLLDAVTTQPQQHLSRLPLLTEREQRQLTMQCQVGEYLGTESLSQLFEAQVERTPQAIALVFEEEQLTYQELNGRANCLAHLLQALGVGPEVRVGLYLSRSPLLLVALLAVLKVGGAYVPLDPSSPQQRLAFLLEDAEVALLLTQQQYSEQFPAFQGRLFCLDAPHEQATLAGQRPTNPPSVTGTKHLAYVIYTSGSTGQPKGVTVTHGNVSRLFAATQAQFHFTPQDVWTFFHSIAFDFSVWELWGALLTGGRLVIIPYGVSRSPQDFWELLSQEQVTILNQTPSALRQLLTVSQVAARLPALRWLIFGGEALAHSIVEQWWQHQGEQQPHLVNMYGITETTVHVTFHLVERNTLDKSTRKSLIGHPLNDLQLYVLDAHMQPVPVGISGELYVGGAGLARGYLGQPALTAERFVPHPWSQQPGGRLYKTGDLARRLWTGEVEYVGRNDAQVKVRGFRIELGEIEATLTQHPAVQEAVVLLKEESSGEKRLVAYVVPWGQQQPTVNELRRYLQTKLPDYMLPSTFQFLETLPLTTNGKLDSGRLPDPEPVRPVLEECYTAPYTPEEEILAGIWSQVLQVEQVGIHDNFFTLGGDSIRSIQVLALARERGLSCTLTQLFQQPTIAGLAEVLTKEAQSPVAAITSQPFSLITNEDRKRLPGKVEDAYPLTMLQTGMLFHSVYTPQSALYHNVTSHHLESQVPFDLSCLQMALNQVVARHPVLRTSFDLSTYQQPMQLVHQQVEIEIPYMDLRHLAPLEQEEVIARVIESEKECKFDWTQAPLFRVQVHRRSQRAFQLTMTEHHSILDGWSVASLLTEIAERYTTLLANEIPVIDPLQITFRDFVALELESLASKEAQHYWIQQLDGCRRIKLPRWTSGWQKNEPPLLRLIEVPIPHKVAQDLQRLARTTAVPLKSVLLAAHLNVMRVLGGENDVLTGLVTNGRPETVDGEQVLGLFLNTLPYRQHLNGGSWEDLVRETFETERGMLPWRRYPLAQLQLMHGKQELFETAFNFTYFYIYKRLEDISNLRVLERKSFIQSNFTLMAHFSQELASMQLHLHLECNASKLSTEQIETFAGYYSRTLAAMSCSPTSRYETQSLLSTQEQQFILYEWNDTWTDDIREICLHQLVEDQVDRTPGSEAVIFAGQSLTYRELDERANQVAWYLWECGIGPEILVGVCMERSLEMVIALLGILKAGGAYVPLDPTYPQERLRFICDETHITTILTQHHLQHFFDEQAGDSLNVVSLDTQWQHFSLQRTDQLESGVVNNNLAYVIYTSGSTGTPKGAMNTHRGICNRLLWMQEQYQLRADDRVLQKTPFSFDVSVWEFFWPLITGACLVIAPPERHRDAAYLTALIKQQRITTLHFVPSMLWLFLEEPDAASCTCIKRVICSGEALSVELQERFFACLSGQLYNLYGPTEAAVDVSAWTCTQEEQPYTVPIGYPIANIQLYILNAELQPVPVGVVGELYIGGVGLARGYVARPDLTAERFIPDPFNTALGRRLYKTGDRVRYLPDGAIEFLGRLDYQVKIRGFRIELGEIEAVLSKHPAIQQCVVIAHEDKSSDRTLIAYIVPTQEQPITINALRQYLHQYLPQYMLPAIFLFLPSLPLTASGKVNRVQLPMPEGERPSQLETVFVSPTTPVEVMLAKIFCQALQIEKVGIYDNFFELGGHSLQATRMVSLIRKMLLVEIPIRSIFEAPTVAQLAQELVHYEIQPGQVSAAARLSQSIQEMSLQEIRAQLVRNNDVGKSS